MVKRNKKIKYFAYGSNLNYQWLKKRCPSARIISIAKLKDYQLRYDYPSTLWPGQGAADIVARPDSVTWGVLYQMAESDLKNLDVYEDVPSGGYKRAEVKVYTHRQPVKAVTYEVIDKLAEERSPSVGYGRLIIKGALQQGLPKEYRQQLQRSIDVLKKQNPQAGII